MKEVSEVNMRIRGFGSSFRLKLSKRFRDARTIQACRDEGYAGHPQSSSCKFSQKTDPTKDSKIEVPSLKGLPPTKSKHRFFRYF
jgi:hypothetical protein